MKLLLLFCFGVLCGCTTVKKPDSVLKPVLPFVLMQANHEKDYFLTHIDHVNFDEVPIYDALKTITELWQAKHPDVILPKIVLCLPWSEACRNGCVCSSEDESIDELALDQDELGDDLGNLDDDFGDLIGETMCRNEDFPRVSMVVDDISILDLIKFICLQSDLKYRKDHSSILIKEKTHGGCCPPTEFYELSDAHFEALGVADGDWAPAEEHLKRYGFLKYDGESIRYYEDINKVIANIYDCDQKRLLYFFEFFQKKYLLEQLKMNDTK